MNQIKLHICLCEEPSFMAGRNAEWCYHLLKRILLQSQILSYHRIQELIHKMFVQMNQKIMSSGKPTHEYLQ